MLTIIDVNYDKNYFSAKVTEDRIYQIEDKLFNLQQGSYMIHLDYGFIRTLKQMFAVKPKDIPKNKPKELKTKSLPKAKKKATAKKTVKK